MPHKDPDVKIAYDRAYYNKHRDRDRDRRKATNAALHANERAAGYGIPERITPEEAHEVLSARLCFYCGGSEPRPWWALDHRIPLSEGGPNTRENLVCTCHSCNSKKGLKASADQWSRAFDECQGCGSSDRKHLARGLCRRCYAADRRAST